MRSTPANWAVWKRATAFALAALFALVTDVLVCTDAGHHVARDPRTEALKLQVLAADPDDNTGPNSKTAFELPFKGIAALSAHDAFVFAATTVSRADAPDADARNDSLAHRRTVVLLI